MQWESTQLHMLKLQGEVDDQSLLPWGLWSSEAEAVFLQHAT